MSFSKIFQVFIVVRASTVHAEVMFASIRKLTIRLALSVVITGLSGVLIFGLSTPSHAQGKADCVGKECANIGGKVGDAPTTREIRYTIWNDSARTVKFRLPTGRTYRLRPDERGHYKNSSKDGHIGTAPVGCFPSNGFGLFDMAGNVWEIVNDKYQSRHTKEKTNNPVGPNKGFDPREPNVTKHVIKGGSYLCTPMYCMRYRPSARQPQDITMGTSHIGFRTVLNK